MSRWAPALGTSRLVGLRHGPRLRRWEATHGSLVAAQLKAPGAQWPGVLERVVASAEAEDFELSGEAVDACLDLVVVLEKSG